MFSARSTPASWASIAVWFGALAALFAGLFVLGVAWSVPAPLLVVAGVLLTAAGGGAAYCGVSATLAKWSSR